MRTLILFAVLAAVFANDLPSPKLTKLVPNGVEISIEGVPGVLYKLIKYAVNGETHFGRLHKSADGKWYHRNFDVTFDNGKLHYEIAASKDGKALLVDGEFTEGQGAAVALSSPVRRAGHTVLRDDFNFMDTSKWDYEVSMYGGYNWEIQVYTNDKLNVFSRDGKLFIKPTYTSDKFSEAYLTSGTMDVRKIWGTCTNNDRYGCTRTGDNTNVLPPIMSGRIKSKSTIRFGRVEIRARPPCGDWIWPALWMLPRSSTYGQWPRSGEIDVMESRGNSYASDGNVNHGRTEVSSTLHWGSDAAHNRFMQTHGEKRGGSFCDGFHTWVLDWTCDHLITTVDGQVVMNVHTPPEGFWNHGHFPGANAWASGQKCAPFDQDFYFIMNVAVGGTSGFFPDSWHYNSPKPWKDGSSTENRDFWNARHSWQPSWQGDKVAMEIDYIQMDQY